MILIVVKQPVRSKYADEFPTLVGDFTTASRAEPGCISFDFCGSSDKATAAQSAPTCPAMQGRT